MADKPQSLGDEEPEEGEIQDDDEDGLLEDVSSAEEVPSPTLELKGRKILPNHKYSLPQLTKDCLPRHSLRKSCKHKSQLMPPCTGDAKCKLNVTKYRNECNIPSREVRHVRLNSFVKTDSERDTCFEYKNMIVEYKPQVPKSLQDEDVVHEKENRHGCRDMAKVRKENRRRRHRSLQMSDKKSSSDSESDVEKKKRKQANDGVKRKQEIPKKSEAKSKNSHRKRSQSPKKAKHHAFKKKACKKCSSKKVLKASFQKSTDGIPTNKENSLLKRLQAMMALNVPAKTDDIALDTNKKEYDIVEEVVKDIVNATCDELEKHSTSNNSAGSEEVPSSRSPKDIEILQTVEKQLPEVITIEDTDSSSSEANKEISNEPVIQCSKPESTDKKGENNSADPETLNDEDEDLLQLRMLALQSSRRKEARRPNKEEDEILQLRLEALRSAVLKKYKDRKQRGHILKSKQCSSKTSTLEQQKNKDELQDDFPLSPPGFSPLSPIGSSPIPVLGQAEPDETTTIVDMDLSNTDDEKEPGTSTQGIPDDFCKQIPLPDETSSTSYLAGKEGSVKVLSSKSIAVEHSNEPVHSPWEPPPPPPPLPLPPSYSETEISFNYNNCQIPETYNSNKGNSSANFANSVPSYAAASTTYQCQTYNEFYINNSGLPTTDLDGAPLDPLPGSYDVHSIPTSAFVPPISCGSNSHCFTHSVSSLSEMPMSYMERDIVNANIIVSSQENQMPSSIVKNVKETRKLYPKSVASYESTFRQSYPSNGAENIALSSVINTDGAMSCPSPQPVAISERTINKPSEENTEEDEEFLRAQLLTALAAKKKKPINTVVPAKMQPNVASSQKDILSLVKNNLASKNIASKMSTFSFSSKNVEMPATYSVTKNISSKSVTSIANGSRNLYGQNQYSGQQNGKKVTMKKTSPPTVRQQVLIKNALKLNKFTSVYKSITPSSSSKIGNNPKSWKKSLKKSVSPLNLKQWTKINKKNNHLAANVSHSSTFNIKPTTIMQSSTNVRTSAVKSSSPGIMFGANRNSKLTSLKVTVPAKASDSAHGRRTVAESKRDTGSSNLPVSRFVIRLGEDSDSGDENDQSRLMTPVSKRRCVLKGGCPVLTVSTENVSPVSDVIRVQQSSIAGSTKQKSAQLPGSAPSADFERSVDMFLKQARLSQESRITASGGASSEKSSEKQGNTSVTPLAVRHLPSSQQEEYRRLKQQIADLEEQRRQRLKEQIPSKIVRKSNSPCSPSRVVTENSSEKSFKIVISNTVPEKKQLPQTAHMTPKMQSIPPKSVESEVIPVHSATKIFSQSKALPPQSLSVSQKSREVAQEKKADSASTKATNKDESFLSEIKTTVTNPDTGNELQKKSQPSNKTSDSLSIHEVRISPECNTSLDSSAKNSEVVEKQNVATEVLLETTEISEDSIEDKLVKLADAELRLLSRRYALLDDLTDMSALLRQVAVENTIEDECIKEVERLQMELKRAEEKLSQQRNLISSMKTNMAESYQRVAKGRLECNKISKTCQTLGIGTKGDKYKVPAGGAQLMNLKLQQVYAQTQELCKKTNSYDDVVSTDLCAEQETLEETQAPGDAKSVESNVPKVSQAESDITVPTPASSAELTTARQSAVDVLDISCEHNVKENASAEVDPSKNSTECSFKDIKTISTGGVHEHCMDWYEPVLGRGSHEDRLKLPSSLVEYRSPLEHLKFNRGESGNEAKTIDPLAILCPFELMGSCQDDECSYQHQGR